MKTIQLVQYERGDHVQVLAGFYKGEVDGY